MAGRQSLLDKEAFVLLIDERCLEGASDGDHALHNARADRRGPARDPQNLIAFNDAVAGPSGFERIAVLLKDDSGISIGGLWGKFSYDWLTIELLVVPDKIRGEGWGRRLVSAAEEAASRRGCVGVWLDTHGFQAPEFYKSIGYEIFGTLPKYPHGYSRYFLSKILN